MKVGGTTRSTPVASASSGKASTRPQPQKSGAGEKDNVSISSKSSQLQALESSIEDAPDVNIEKIESIKQAISNGSFSISSGRVAENMMAVARELLTKQKA